MGFKRNDDHWAFLEDIEAPMWVDLNLEAESNNQDNDDKWFYTSHQFHQCSSRQLKSVLFSHAEDECTGLDFELSGPSSPNLPLSVSKSRGKQYQSKKWKGENKDFSFNKSHPVKILSGNSSCVTKPEHGDKIRHKSSFILRKETSTSDSVVACESSSSGKAVSKCSKPLPTCGGPGSSLSSEANKVGESNPSSTVTSESGQQQQLKVMDVSSQAFGHTSDLFSVMKISLRKNRVMRQATRVEINNDGKQSKGCNSTSSKSSVGSSSNPRYDVRTSTSTSTRAKEATPDSRNVGRMTYVVQSKLSSSGIAKASTTKVEVGASNNRRGGRPNFGKSTHQEAAKQKVPYRPSGAKALVPSRVNERNSIVAASKPKKKTGTGGSKNLAGNEKENVTGKTAASQKCKGKVTAAGGGGMVSRGHQGTQQNLSVKIGIAGTIRSKGKAKGEDNLEKSKNSIQGVYFR
ncbi:hypothetical protein PanWU01x14_265540 [Parasponia andersonii]|uniref:Uncharacterized protein n=1 Tax=Parasponia andersonii TaxID=3476 RepID=A0A2P5B6Y7_PARAD|nr:hypothetical protein PanWU01x14_265540 [Parasponia andersonii]